MSATSGVVLMITKGALLLLCVALYCNRLCGGEVCRPLSYSQLITPATCWQFDLDSIQSSERNFEFVFILEIAEHTNQTKISFVKEILNHLIAATYTSNYGDFSTKCALVFYYVSMSDNQIVSTDFRTFYTSKELNYLIDKATNYSWIIGTTPLSTNSLRYVTVVKSLQVLSELTNGDPVVTSIDSGKEATLNFNENSEKHFVLFTDLFAQKKKKSSTKKIDTYQITSDINELVVSLEGNIHRSSKYAITVVLDPASKIATTTYGDPNYTRAYSDGTHFNKAMTLKALLKAKNEQSNTLQAHLLHKGVYMKIARLRDLQDGYRSLNPALWSSGSIYSGFVNRCSKLHHCTHCSALHGCYQPKTRKTLSQPKKYLMSADYSGAGHKRFNPENNIHKSVSEEKLTIYSLPFSGSAGMKLSTVVTGTVPEVEWSPNKPFAEDIISKGQPVILKNTTVTKWPALRKWTSDYLMKHLTPTTILESVKCSNGFLTFDPDVCVPLKLNISVPFVTSNMSSIDFFSCLRGKCADGYKGHYYFGSVPSKLTEDMTNDRFLFLTKDDYDSRKQFVWVSSAGMITHGHFDQDFNFFIQISGKKRFTLWHSTQHELLYMYPRVHPMWHKSRVNFRNIDPQRFPLFLKSQALQVTVEPGDMLYIPPYTWHYVETLTPSVSLSTWSHDYRLYDHMNSIYKYDHKFDELANPKGEHVMHVHTCSVC